MRVYVGMYALWIDDWRINEENEEDFRVLYTSLCTSRQ